MLIMTFNNPKLVIGFITYGKLTARYLPYFLPSLQKQTFQDFQIFVIDNNEEQDHKSNQLIKKYFSEAEIEWTGENVGFARAHNRMINKAEKKNAQYYLSINIDIILEPDAVEQMIKAMDSYEELGSVCPKILRWDFPSPPAPLPLRRERGAKCKTNIIDSCGIQEISALRFKDVGQGEVDNGQYDNTAILGPSGAAAMYRIGALKKIGFDKKPPSGFRSHSVAGVKYFDELMFMYEEDCDLAYRLMLAEYKSKLIPEAVIYHDRTASAKGMGNLQIAINRKNKSRQVKSWGFLHKHIMFMKYWRILPVKQKLEVLWFAFRMFAFAVVFEQYLLKEYGKLWRLRNKI